MSISTNFVSCPEIQKRLPEAFMKLAPNQIMEPVGLTEFLMSPLNRDGVAQEQISPGDGKRRDLRLVYDARLPESEINDSVEKVCDSENIRGELSQNYTIDDDGVADDWKVRLTDLDDRCESDETYVARKIMNSMNALIRRMETKNMTQAAALIGSFASDEDNVVADVKTVQTKKANNDPDISYLEDITFASMNAGFPNVPIVIGWKEIWQAFRRLDATCCADSGLDLAEFASKNGVAIIPSHKTNAILDANHFLTIAPGALQLIWFNEYDGPNGIRVMNDDSYKQGILTHPTMGIPFDFHAKYDCGQIFYQLKLAHKVIGMPADMFSAGGDRLEGVTFVNEYVVTNP